MDRSQSDAEYPPMSTWDTVDSEWFPISPSIGNAWLEEFVAGHDRFGDPVLPEIYVFSRDVVNGYWYLANEKRPHEQLGRYICATILRNPDEMKLETLVAHGDKGKGVKSVGDQIKLFFKEKLSAEKSLRVVGEQPPATGTPKTAAENPYEARKQARREYVRARQEKIRQNFDKPIEEIASTLQLEGIKGSSPSTVSRDLRKMNAVETRGKKRKRARSQKNMTKI